MGIVSAVLRNDGGLCQNCSEGGVGHGLVPKVCLGVCEMGFDLMNWTDSMVLKRGGSKDSFFF